MGLNEGPEPSHFNAAAQGVDAYVGSRIRQCRVDRGRSLQSLAAQLNMRPEQLETYESGKDRIMASQLKELAKALDVPLSYFFDGLADQLDKLRAADTGWRSVGMLLKGPMLLSIAYYLGAQAAFFLGTLSDRIFAPFWPPNVILFCALLFVPYKRWWHYAAAAIPAHILAELQVGMPMLQIAVAFVTNCMVAFLSAAGVRGLLGGPPWLDSFQRASVYVVITAVVSPGVAALGGAFVRISEGAALEFYGLFWAQWYLANALASLTLGPAILTCAEWRTDLAGSRSRWRQGEALLVAICLALACVLVCHVTPLIAGPGLLPALLYLPLPIIIWAAVRFGAKGASGAVLIVTVGTIWSALDGTGMFVGADPEKNVLNLQLFLVALSVPVLLLGASVDGARRAEQVIRELARNLLVARDDERRRVAKDLHESIAQTLVAATWTAADAQRRVPQARSTLKHLEELLQQAIRKLRAVSYLLHPPLLDEAGLESALSQYADEYSRRNATTVDLEVSPDLGRLPHHVELALYRLVEQALDTVRRESPGEPSRIRLTPASTSGNRDVLLTVEGTAKDTPPPGGVPSMLNKADSLGRTQSMEIASMRERVGRMGGELQFESSASKAVIRAIIPLGRSA